MQPATPSSRSVLPLAADARLAGKIFQLQYNCTDRLQSRRLSPAYECISVSAQFLLKCECATRCGGRRGACRSWCRWMRATASCCSSRRPPVLCAACLRFNLRTAPLSLKISSFISVVPPSEGRILSLSGPETPSHAVDEVRNASNGVGGTRTRAGA